MLPEVKCLFLFSGPLYYAKQGGENDRVFYTLLVHLMVFLVGRTVPAQTGNPFSRYFPS